MLDVYIHFALETDLLKDLDANGGVVMPAVPHIGDKVRVPPDAEVAEPLQGAVIWVTGVLWLPSSTGQRHVLVVGRKYQTDQIENPFTP